MVGDKSEICAPIPKNTKQFKEIGWIKHLNRLGIEIINSCNDIDTD